MTTKAATGTKPGRLTDSKWWFCEIGQHAKCTTEIELSLRFEACPCECHQRPAEQPVSVYSDAVQQAFRDWNEHRAYIDNGGNYRLRPAPATPTHRPKGGIASWNKEVKRLFPSCREFHAAAQEWEQESLKPGLLTDEEAQLVIGAIPLQALPAADTGAEWWVSTHDPTVVIGDDHQPVARALANTVADLERARHCAAKIVSEHNAMPKLIDALSSVRLLLLQLKSNEYTEDAIADIDAVLAAAVSNEAKEQINR
jgi:hypothetical protein